MRVALAFAAAAVVVASPVLARGGGGGGSHAVSGYTKSNGTYVAPTRATNPNGTKSDNYSTKGNVNPATGVEGTKKPD